MTLVCRFALAAMPVTVTYAEQAVKLSRGTAMYSAGRGAVLLPNDLLMSDASTVLLDAGGATVAVGPASALFVRDGELVLLAGWLKVDGGAARALPLATGGLQFDGAGSAATLHATPGTAELFAESAAIAVLPLPANKLSRRTTIPREQFGVRTGARPLQVIARPPAAFLAGMPRTFLDPLVAVPVKGPAAPPRRERAATLAELAPLLADHPALRQQMRARFHPPRDRAAKPSPLPR
ncbi:hypothetical protein [Pseudoduganella lurida]|nr:hypothetical protein [Pseudoduganella lurida]